MRRRRSALLLPIALLPAAFAHAGCRAPTQVTLQVRTDIPCSKLGGTVIRVGSPSDTEGREPTATTTSCSADGTIGSLVVVPSGAADAEVGVVVVSGRGVDPEQECLPPSYKPPSAKAPPAGTQDPDPPGCVVARRRLHFIAHEPLKLPIDLRGICVGNPCAPGSTCVGGKCFDATLSDPSTCAEGDGCGETVLTTPAPTSPKSDAGAGGSGTGGTGTGGGATGGSGGSAGGADAGAGGSATDGGLPATTGEGLSCSDGLLCMNGTVSCCANQIVNPDHATFQLGRGDVGPDAFPAGDGNETPAHPAKIAPYYLDSFEVTVGRFKKFFDVGYDSVALGDGQNPHLADPPASGFPPKNMFWAAKADLLNTMHSGCAPTGVSGILQWTNLDSPMNCVTWFEAFAFCAWDGGRLPTEAEWEAASAGTDEERLYPWGGAAPDDTRANYATNDPTTPPGAHPAGDGRFHHHDLAGSLSEWVLDAWAANWYGGGGNPCDDCANLTDFQPRTIQNQSGRLYAIYRGGSAFDLGPDLRAARRFAGSHRAIERLKDVGFRCARDVK